MNDAVRADEDEELLVSHSRSGYSSKEPVTVRSGERTQSCSQNVNGEDAYVSCVCLPGDSIAEETAWRQQQ